MSSATGRFFFLLPVPFPLRLFHYPRPFLSTARLFVSLPPPPLSTPRRFHFKPRVRSLNDPQSIDSSRDSYPWPEWCNLISSFNFSPTSDRVQADFGLCDFVDGGQALPADFARAAHACLAFARHHEQQLWSLPREDIEVVVQNGSPFLFKDAEDTMRRMKLFLNGSTYNVMGSDKPSTVDLMKFLLSYASTVLASSDANCFARGAIVEASVRRLFSELAEISGSSEPANSGSRPKQFPETNGQFPGSSAQLVQMKRGDWVCPRCRFVNFARNMKCLECEESRPKRQLTGGEWECPQCDFFNYGRNTVCLRCDCKKPGMINPVAVSGHGHYPNNGSSEKRFTESLEKPQNWFSKISQMENVSNGSGAAVDQPFQETVSLKEGLAFEGNTLKRNGDESHHVITEGFSEILAHSSDISGSRSWDTDVTCNNGSRRSATTIQSMPPQFGNPYNSPTAMDDQQKEQDEKSQRWFTRVEDPHDTKDLPSGVSEKDFPETMPTRKGENRFFVREKKDRSLTSPLYKRRMAMEQSASNNYVPFVPFPSDYFAKGKQLANDESGSPSTSSTQKQLQPNINSATGYSEGSVHVDRAGPLLNQRSAGEVGYEKSANSGLRAQNSLHQTQNSAESPLNTLGYGNDHETLSEADGETGKEANPWRGSSLEGSAVKEPDPLDMSEEAKAERWFRRVAQIKDIKELSEIPDEDFPSIMPMRKGVNRFVVSRRKTPLERRLASSQYRRNLPVVSSDPPRKDVNNFEN